MTGRRSPPPSAAGAACSSRRRGHSATCAQTAARGGKNGQEEQIWMKSSRVRAQPDAFRLKAHLEDELPESVRVLVVEQQGVARVGGAGFEEEQEELVPGRAALKEAEQQLQQATQLQDKHGT